MGQLMQFYHNTFSFKVSDVLFILLTNGTSTRSFCQKCRGLFYLWGSSSCENLKTPQDFKFRGINPKQDSLGEKTGAAAQNLRGSTSHCHGDSCMFVPLVNAIFWVKL